MGKFTISTAIFNSYVSLPEDTIGKDGITPISLVPTLHRLSHTWIAGGTTSPRRFSVKNFRDVKKESMDNMILPYRMGPPSDVCGFINHEITPMNYSYYNPYGYRIL